MTFFALSLSMVFSCTSPASSTHRLTPWIGTGSTRVLVDGNHQLEAHPDLVFDENEFAYSPSQSISRVMRNLVEQHDFRFRQLHEGPLTLELLRAHDVLFFNVPTFVKSGSSKSARKMPDFSDDEIAALTQWLNEGGAAWVIGEHNNAYDNMEGLNPFLKPLGIEILAAYASETGRGRYAMDRGGYILMIRNYEPHPVTDGVRMTSWSGGAPFAVGSRGGVAFLSETGFIDYGNYMTEEPMKWSNHKVDEALGEYQGPGIPVMLAADVGEGRLVVSGDHNMIGNQWLGIGDNYRFTVNAFQWLAFREDEAPFRDEPPLGIRFGFEQEIGGWTVGRRDIHSYYNFFYNLSRRPDVFPIGMMDLADDVDVVGFLDPNVAYPEPELVKVDRALQSGQRVFLLVDAEQPGRGSVQLLRRYLPDLELESDGQTFVAGQLDEASVARVEGSGVVVAPELRLRQESIAALAHARQNIRRGRDPKPRDYDEGKPYLLDLQVHGGEELVGATLPDGRHTTLLTRLRTDQGEIWLMPQGAIWRGNTLPTVREEPVHANQPAYDLQMAFVEWMASNPARDR